MEANNINIEEIMADIKREIKEKGLTNDMLSFDEVPYKSFIVPKKWIKVNAGRILTDEERSARAERMRNIKSAKISN